MDDRLYLELCTRPKRLDINYVVIDVPLETLILLCVYKYCNISHVKIYFVVTGREGGFRIKLALTKREENDTVLEKADVPWDAASCCLPIAASGCALSAGLSAASRRLCANTPDAPNPSSLHPDGLLGFRGGCLQAPNETSVWTKFCEVEILETILDFSKNIKNNQLTSNLNKLIIPVDFLRFEYHLNKPIKVHNVYKLARDMAKLSIDKTEDSDTQKEREVHIETKSIEKRLQRTTVKLRKWKSTNTEKIIHSSVPIECLGLSHDFAEGPHFTLADILLYPQFFLAFAHFKPQSLKTSLPATYDWFKRLNCLEELKGVNKLLNESVQLSFDSKGSDLDVLYFDEFIPDVKNFSLYKCDPKRSNKKKIFTKEDDVESALGFINQALELKYVVNDNDMSRKIDWSIIPLDASPYGGHLPEDRKQRKTQQLENLATVVMSIAKSGDKIVDFCSGGGHLGILLAHLLPECTIILLENKEQSLKRAQARVQSLGLNNVYFFQCNLDFFKGYFDIGVALHACGVSTDLVLENCINKKASFVICPCCYGSLHETNRLQYPRSEAFNSVPIDRYLCIGHAADQTHTDHPMEKRGARCMTIIDSDRARHAMSNGYSVTLSRLVPLSCTPKNMLIVGVPDIHACA